MKPSTATPPASLVDRSLHAAATTKTHHTGVMRTHAKEYTKASGDPVHPELQNKPKEVTQHAGDVLVSIDEANNKNWVGLSKLQTLMASKNENGNNQVKSQQAEESAPPDRSNNPDSIGARGPSSVEEVVERMADNLEEEFEKQLPEVLEASGLRERVDRSPPNAPLSEATEGGIVEELNEDGAAAVRLRPSRDAVVQALTEVAGRLSDDVDLVEERLIQYIEHIAAKEGVDSVETTGSERGSSIGNGRTESGLQNPYLADRELGLANDDAALTGSQDADNEPVHRSDSLRDLGFSAFGLSTIMSKIVETSSNPDAAFSTFRDSPFVKEFVPKPMMELVELSRALGVGEDGTPEVVSRIMDNPPHDDGTDLELMNVPDNDSDKVGTEFTHPHPSIGGNADEYMAKQRDALNNGISDTHGKPGTMPISSATGVPNFSDVRNAIAEIVNSDNKESKEYLLPLQVLAKKSRDMEPERARSNLDQFVGSQDIRTELSGTGVASLSEMHTLWDGAKTLDEKCETLQKHVAEYGDKTKELGKLDKEASFFDRVVDRNTTGGEGSSQGNDLAILAKLRIKKAALQERLVTKRQELEASRVSIQHEVQQIQDPGSDSSEIGLSQLRANLTEMDGEPVAQLEEYLDTMFNRGMVGMESLSDGNSEFVDAIAQRLPAHKGAEAVSSEGSNDQESLRSAHSPAEPAGASGQTLEPDYDIELKQLSQSAFMTEMDELGVRGPDEISTALRLFKKAYQPMGVSENVLKNEKWGDALRGVAEATPATTNQLRAVAQHIANGVTEGVIYAARTFYADVFTSFVPSPIEPMGKASLWVAALENDPAVWSTTFLETVFQNVTEEFSNYTHYVDDPSVREGFTAINGKLQSALENHSMAIIPSREDGLSINVDGVNDYNVNDVSQTASDSIARSTQDFESTVNDLCVFLSETLEQSKVLSELQQNLVLADARYDLNQPDSLDHVDEVIRQLKPESGGSYPSEAVTDRLIAILGMGSSQRLSGSTEGVARQQLWGNLKQYQDEISQNPEGASRLPEATRVEAERAIRVIEAFETAISRDDGDRRPPLSANPVEIQQQTKDQLKNLSDLVESRSTLLKDVKLPDGDSYGDGDSADKIVKTMVRAAVLSLRDQGRSAQPLERDKQLGMKPSDQRQHPISFSMNDVKPLVQLLQSWGMNTDIFMPEIMLAAAHVSQEVVDAPGEFTSQSPIALTDELRPVSVDNGSLVAESSWFDDIPSSNARDLNTAVRLQREQDYPGIIDLTSMDHRIKTQDLIRTTRFCLVNDAHVQDKMSHGASVLGSFNAGGPIPFGIPLLGGEAAASGTVFSGIDNSSKRGFSSHEERLTDYQGGGVSVEGGANLGVGKGSLPSIPRYSGPEKKDGWENAIDRSTLSAEARLIGGYDRAQSSSEGVSVAVKKVAELQNLFEGSFVGDLDWVDMLQVPKSIENLTKNEVKGTWSYQAGANVAGGFGAGAIDLAKEGQRSSTTENVAYENKDGIDKKERTTISTRYSFQRSAGGQDPISYTRVLERLGGGANVAFPPPEANNPAVGNSHSEDGLAFLTRQNNPTDEGGDSGFGGARPPRRGGGDDGPATGVLGYFQQANGTASYGRSLSDSYTPSRQERGKATIESGVFKKLEMLHGATFNVGETVRQNLSDIAGEPFVKKFDENPEFRKTVCDMFSNAQIGDFAACEYKLSDKGFAAIKTLEHQIVILENSGRHVQDDGGHTEEYKHLVQQKLDAISTDLERNKYLQPAAMLRAGVEADGVSELNEAALALSRNDNEGRSRRMVKGFTSL